MAEKTKYVLLVDDDWSDLTIAKLDDMKDLGHVVFYDDMNIGRICLHTRRYTRIAKLNSLDTRQQKNIILEDHAELIHDFNAKDIHELLIRLETEGYVAELEQEPSCIRDLIANVSVSDDAQHKLVSDMSRRILELEEENYDLRRNLLEVKDQLNDFIDAAKKLNDNKELFKE